MTTTKSLTAADRKAIDRAYVALVATGAADDRTRFVRAGHLITLDGFGLKSGAIAAEWNRRAGWDAIAPETVRAILTSAKRVLAADVALDAQTLAASYRARKVPADRLAFLVDQTKANVSPDKRGDALIAAFDQARQEVNALTRSAVATTKEVADDIAAPATEDGGEGPQEDTRTGSAREGAAGGERTDRPTPAPATVGDAVNVALTGLVGRFGAEEVASAVRVWLSRQGAEAAAEVASAS